MFVVTELTRVTISSTLAIVAVEYTHNSSNLSAFNFTLQSGEWIYFVRMFFLVGKAATGICLKRVQSYFTVTNSMYIPFVHLDQRCKPVFSFVIK